MAAITTRGTCVPAGASRNAAATPFTVWASEGNCARTQAMSNFLVTELSRVEGMIPPSWRPAGAEADGRTPHQSVTARSPALAGLAWIVGRSRGGAPDAPGPRSGTT